MCSTLFISLNFPGDFSIFANCEAIVEDADAVVVNIGACILIAHCRAVVENADTVLVNMVNSVFCKL